MRKWMDKGGAKVEGGTPAPRGVTYLTNWNLYLYPIWRYERWYKITKMGCFGVVRCHSRSLEIVPLTDCIQVYPRRATSAWVKTNKAFWLIFNQIFVSNPNPKNRIRVTRFQQPGTRFLNQVISQLTTSTYMPNFIEIEETFCGRTDGRVEGHLRPTLLGRLGGEKGLFCRINARLPIYC